jgi:hypothetical protein
MLHLNPYLHKLQMSPTLPTHRISALYASAPVKLLYCPRCRNTLAVEGWVHPEHEWAVILSCSSGSRPRWSVCRACPKARVHLDSEESFAWHRLRYHQERERSTQVCPGNFVTSAGNGNQSGSTYLLGRAFFGKDHLASTLWAPYFFAWPTSSSWCPP